MAEHPQNKAVVIDSRLRASPEEGKSISLFFLVEQIEPKVDSDEKVDVNMEQRYTVSNVTVDIQIPLKKNEEYENKWKGTQIPQVLLLCHDRPTPNVVQWSGPPDHTT